MSGRSKAIALLACIAALGIGYAALDSEIGRALTGRWTFTKSVEVDRGTYYRLKVNLAYKGEPQDFDIVVGCNVRITTYKDNDRSVEVGIAPMAYGLKMKDEGRPRHRGAPAGSLRAARRRRTARSPQRCCRSSSPTRRRTSPGSASPMRRMMRTRARCPS